MNLTTILMQYSKRLILGTKKSHSRKDRSTPTPPLFATSFYFNNSKWMISYGPIIIRKYPV